MGKLSFRRKHGAVLFKSAAELSAQAEPTIVNSFDRSTARNGHSAPAPAAEVFRLALSVEDKPSGFSKSVRSFTKHITIK